MAERNALQIATQARVNEYFRTALEATPDYARAVALRDKALTQRNALTPLPKPAPPTSIDEDMDKWLTSLAKHDANQRTQDIQKAALTSLINTCENEISAVVMVDPDTLLQSMNNDMTELMRDIAAIVTRLNGANTPEQAISNGTAEAWRELPVLRQSYDQIRQAQEFVMVGELQWNGSRSNYLSDPLASDAAIANLDNIFPHWRTPDRTTHLGNKPDPRPWPQSPIEQLVWLSTSDAEVWVPTLDQLEKLHDERRRRRSGVTNVTAQLTGFRSGRPDRINH